MPLPIAQRLSRLKAVIARDPTRGDLVAREWTSLMQTCNPIAMKIPDTEVGENGHWAEILLSTFVPDVINDHIPNTLNIAGSMSECWMRIESFRSAMTILSSCIFFGARCVKNPRRKAQHAATVAMMQTIAEGGLGVILKWWMPFRHLAIGWVRDSLFTQYAIPFTGLIGDIQQALYEAGPVFPTSYMEIVGRTSPGLRDLMLLHVICSDCKEPEQVKLIDCAITTLAQELPHPTEDFTSLVKVLQIKPETLCTRLNLFLREHKTYRMPTVVTLIAWIQEIPALNGSSLYTEDVGYTMGSVMWKAYAECDRERRDLLPYRLMCALGCLVNRSGHRGTGLMTYLLEECDYLAMLEKLISDMVVCPDRYPYPEWERWNLQLHILCTSPDALRKYLRRDFLYMIDYLRPLAERPNAMYPRKLLRWWHDLGTAAGVTEADMRAELVKKRNVANRDAVIGCSWLKCVRFERECEDVALFQCARCQRSMYCGTQCQERDWTDGGHKKTCKPRATMNGHQ